MSATIRWRMKDDTGMASGPASCDTRSYIYIESISDGSESNNGDGVSFYINNYEDYRVSGDEKDGIYEIPFVFRYNMWAFPANITLQQNFFVDQYCKSSSSTQFRNVGEVINSRPYESNQPVVIENNLSQDTVDFTYEKIIPVTLSFTITDESGIVWYDGQSAQGV